MAYKTLTIYNKKTGETKQIPIADAPKFGINAEDAVKQFDAQGELDKRANSPRSDLNDETKEAEEGLQTYINSEKADPDPKKAAQAWYNKNRAFFASSGVDEKHIKALIDNTPGAEPLDENGNPIPQEEPQQPPRETPNFSAITSEGAEQVKPQGFFSRMIQPTEQASSNQPAAMVTPAPDQQRLLDIFKRKPQQASNNKNSILNLFRR